MSRHNRRRTRANHRLSSALPPFPTFELSNLGSVALPSDSQHKTAIGLPRGNPKRHDLIARHWHNRYIAWLVREANQREEREQLMVEQKRIFGGEIDEEDTDGLCSNMMGYFVGLDFIMESEGQERR
ncbi:MAG: hypothetical protein LQ349_004574 [Xanthoria aureola]|nr:MAG: hypothetical protein LQ349_004574 [Xanthoria aureola]